MIIKRFEVNKKIIDKFNFFLLYGKNEGLQNEIIKLQFIKIFSYVYGLLANLIVVYMGYY